MRSRVRRSLTPSAPVRLARRRVRGAGRALALGAAVLSCIGAHRAARAENGVRIDQMQPAAPESPFFRVEGPHLALPQVEYAFGLTLDYGTSLVRSDFIDKAGNQTLEVVPVRHALLAHATASLTPIHWLEADVSIPIGVFETGDDTKSVTGYGTAYATATAGIGDPRLGVHVRPLDEKQLGVILGARFWAPFGSSDAYLSDKDFRLEADVGLAGEARSFLYGCMMSVAPRFFAANEGDRVALSCAAHYLVRPDVSVGVEPTFALMPDKDPSGHVTYLAQFEPLAATRISFGPARVGVGLGPGFGAAPGVASFRALASIAYVGSAKPKPPPRPKGPKDRDLDGIPDERDACPTEAGPDNPDPARRGCPTHDRDGDGIADANDACPEQPGAAHENPKANGCPDTDNDTLPDPIDQCPEEPGPAPTGCPRYARLQEATFVVTPPIAFLKDGKLTPESRGAIEEISATMRANTKLEQVSINLGTRGLAAKVADKRAEEILTVLRAGNLDSSRYEVVLREDLKAGVVEIRVYR